MTNIFKIASMNVQGIGDKAKRKDVLNYLRNKKYNIYCLQDTHFTDKEIKIIRSQWGYECFFSNFNSQSRGVAILINNNFDFKYIKTEKDDNGNLLCIECQTHNKMLTLICLYGPNKDDPHFFVKLKEKLSQINHDYIIVGDFNLVLQPDIDYFNYNNVNNPKARETVLEMILEYDLIDPWREQNLEKLQYTWFKKNPVKKARLDFFLISSNLFTDVENAYILPGYRTDHSLIILEIHIGKFKKGSSYWKFNNSLLKDINYITQIKRLIKDTKNDYKVNLQNNVSTVDEIHDKDIIFSIDDKLFFETLMMLIRGKTIAYASEKKKQNTQREELLIKEIETLQTIGTNNLGLLEEKNNELLRLRKNKLEGSLIRSRAKWVLEGEKPTKYFCNLENRHFTSKLMNCLYSHDGKLLNTQKQLLQETERHYKQLYAFNDVKQVDLNNIIGNNSFKKLSVEEKISLEGKITYEEMLFSLKKCQIHHHPVALVLQQHFLNCFGQIWVIF